MGRVNKLYATLDALVEEYRGLLIKELEKEGNSSSYLHKCRDDEHIGRAYWIHGKSTDLAEANEMLDMERQIRQLCEKLAESPPLPIAVLEEYVDAWRSLKTQKAETPWLVKDFEHEHKMIRKRLHQKLQDLR